MMFMTGRTVLHFDEDDLFDWCNKITTDDLINVFEFITPSTFDT